MSLLVSDCIREGIDIFIWCGGTCGTGHSLPLDRLPPDLDLFKAWRERKFRCQKCGTREATLTGSRGIMGTLAQDLVYMTRGE